MAKNYSEIIDYIEQQRDFLQVLFEKMREKDTRALKLLDEICQILTLLGDVPALGF